MVKNDYKREKFFKMTTLSTLNIMICIIEEVDMHNRGSRLNMAHKANDESSQSIESLHDRYGLTGFLKLGFVEKVGFSLNCWSSSARGGGG